MGKFDRYVLSQLMVIFGLSSVVLVVIYWVNRAVQLFDWLIASGQSAAVFLEFTALTLPSVIRVVLPISALVATLYTTNRLTSESELVVVQANGYSPFRLARPVLVFGLFVSVFTAFLVHFAVPASFTRLIERQFEISENVTARLLVEGRFVHPGDGLTLYIRKIAGSGELQDVYMRDGRDPQRQVTYTATEARLVRTESGPRLIMYDGLAQTLELPARTLSVTRFEDFAVDISSLVDGPVGERSAGPLLREAQTLELLSATEESAARFRTSVERVHLEGHTRIAQPIIAVTGPLIGFAMLLLGGFSRFGIWNQIIGAVVLVALLVFIDNALTDIALANPSQWPLVYVSHSIGAVLAVLLLWLASNPQIWRRRQSRAST